MGQLAHSIPLPTSFVICNSRLDLSGSGLWDHLGHMLDFFFFSLRLVREEMENHHGLLLFSSFLHFYLPLKKDAPGREEVAVILLLQWPSTGHGKQDVIQCVCSPFLASR